MTSTIFDVTNSKHLGMTPSQELEDFTLFLFWHMANVDGSLHPLERETVLEKMDQLFPESSSHEENLRQTEAIYQDSTEALRQARFNEGATIFRDVDPETRQEIYEAMFDIINANGKVDSQETGTLRKIQSWLAP